MKYALKAVKYGTKNSIKAIIFAMIPALFVGLFVNPYCLSKFFAVYPDLKVTNYLSMFNAFFDFDWQNVVLIVLGCALVIFMLSIVFGLIERHMRTGKFSLSESSSMFNNNIMVVAIYFVVIILLYMFSVFIISLLTYCLHLLISGMGKVPTDVNIAVSFVFTAILFLVFFRIAMLLFLSIPETITTGYSMSNCINEVSVAMGKKSRSIYIAYILPMFLHFPLNILSYGLWWNKLIGVLLLAFYIIYYCSLTYIVYFDINNIERKDVTTFNFRFFKR